MIYKVGISQDFFSAFSDLPKQIQGKVTEFINKFRNNPLAPGINLEQIKGAADKKLLSVRIDQTYRGVIAREEQSGVFMLLWVDHHEKAYDWAIRRKIEVNQQTGNLQVYEVKEIALPSDGTVELQPLFAGLTDEQLILMGVPEVQVEYVRSLRTPESFYQSKGVLPDDCYEHLEWIINDFSLEEVLSLVKENLPAMSESHDFESALKTPESLKSFVIVEGEDELRRMLAEPMEKWRIFLHPTQRKVVSRRFSGPARVLGGAGTGKTVVAMHRVKHLVQALKAGETILFTTFTTNLAADIQENLRKICSVEEMRRIEVINLDAWVSRFLREHEYTSKLVYGEQLESIWEKSIAMAGDSSGLGIEFYSDEWTRVVANQEEFTRDTYLSTSRVGRGLRLDRKKRMQVWEVFVEFQNILQEEQVRDIDSAMYECRKLLEKHHHEGLYPHIIVDEAQDLSNNAYRLLRAMSGLQHLNDLFIVGDAHQRIYKRRATLSKSRVYIQGRSSYLRINYRTTEEIRKHAFALLKGIPFDDMDEAYDDGRLCQSLTHGPKPEIHIFKSASEEYAFIIERIKVLEAKGVDLRNICVIARTNKMLDVYMEQLNLAGLRVYEIKRSKAEERSFEGVRVATMHRVKGLEFAYVFIVAANKRNIPLYSAVNQPDEAAREEAMTAERCLLYVSLTRAQREAIVTGYGTISEFLQ